MCSLAAEKQKVTLFVTLFALTLRPEVFAKYGLVDKVWRRDGANICRLSLIFANFGLTLEAHGISVRKLHSLPNGVCGLPHLCEADRNEYQAHHCEHFYPGSHDHKPYEKF